jgi:hypothetical protein
MDKSSNTGVAPSAASPKAAKNVVRLVRSVADA